MCEKVSIKIFVLNAMGYLRHVKQTGQDLIITDHDKPVLKIVPLEKGPMEIVKSLRNPVLKYDDPTEPVGLDDWEELG